MDSPPIQYCRTGDGVNIAYASVGQGLPFVFVFGAGTALFGIHERPQSWLRALADGYRLVLLDYRGLGASDKGATAIEPDDWLRDLDSVVRATAGNGKATLWGDWIYAQTAIAYAARYPELVGGLVLWCPAGRGPDIFRSPASRTIHGPDVSDWETFADAIGAFQAGWTDQEAAGILSALTKAAWTPESTNAMNRVLARMDVSDLLSQVECPVLVLHRNRVRAPDLETARGVAAAIPDARFVPLAGASVIAWAGDSASVLRATRTFVVNELAASGPRESTGAGTTRTLLFTDLESSTALTQSMGDAKAQEVLRGHNDAVRTALEAHGGDEVKHTGDGIMAAFASAVSAVEAALQIQRDLTGAEVRVRVGLNAGEPIAEDGDYFGSAVQLAARVCDRAEPGQVLVPQVVRDLCRGKGFTFADQGEATLKGFPEPVRLFAVREGD